MRGLPLRIVNNFMTISSIEKEFDNTFYHYSPQENEDIKSFYRQKIKEVREEEKQKWWTACMYACDLATYNRIKNGIFALEKPSIKKNYIK